MSDIAITAANVVADAAATRVHGTAGETITAGQWVVKDPTSKKYVKADSNSATAALRTPDGVALNGASLNQPLAIATRGDVTIGGTLTAGVAYYMSDTAGGMCPVADVGTGEYSCVVGMAKSTTVLTVNIQPSGVAL